MGETLRLVFCIVMSSVVKATVSQCEVRNDYFVASYGNNDVDCFKPNRPDLPCATLNFLALGKIWTCATIKIMDDLIVNSSALFPGSKGLTIMGYSFITPDGSVTLQCSLDACIRFYGAEDKFTLEKLHFRNCSCKHNNKFASIIVLTTETTLIYNCSLKNHFGAAIYLRWSRNTTILNSNFSGYPLLINDSSRAGGIVFDSFSFIKPEFIIYISSCSFTNNINNFHSQCSTDVNNNGHGGALEIRTINPNSTGTIIVEDSIFVSNTAKEGGAISVVNSANISLSLLRTRFIANKAFCQGGAVMFGLYPFQNSHGALTIKDSVFDGNNARTGGGVAAIVESCSGCTNSGSVELSDSSWISNSASSTGFAFTIKNSKTIKKGKFNLQLQFFNQNVFNGNYMSENGTGAIVAENSVVVFNSNSEVLFHKNDGTAIVLKSCDTVFEGQASFSSNSGTLGGAILVDGDSVISFGPTCNVSFYNNSASGLGGAIYSSVSEYCTFDVSQMNNGSIVSFGLNSAGLSDQSIYLESISKCDDIEDLLDNFYFENPSEKSVSLPVNSVTIKIIDSENEQELSSQSHISFRLGQTFYIQPTVKNELEQESTGIGYISLKSNYHQLVGPSKINLDSYTSSVEFSIRGQEVLQDTPVTLFVAYEKSGVLDIVRIGVNLVVAPCASSQAYSDLNQTCTCRLEEHDDYRKCSKYNQYVCLKKHYWLSDDDVNSCYPCPALNCIYSVTENGCPYNKTHFDSCDGSDFCIIQNLDDACRKGRTGFLCSECEEGHAFTFEAFHCVSNTTCDYKNTIFLSLCLLAYWVLILLAVMLVLSLKISVGSGFMFGIIYYFSVALIYTRSSAVFGVYWVQIMMYINAAIALLDPGLLGYWEICFVEKWTTPLPHELFRLATPLFLMVSVLVFVLVARYCRLPRRFAMSGSSPVHAICLLILLSYTSVSYTSWKILVPFIAADDTYLVQVAPTMEYFGSDSDYFIPFFVIALFVQVFICLPVCLFFLFAPILSKRVNLVKLRLKPILDEFHACYKPEYRWFAGFYFLARQVVYLVCMSFTESYPQSNSLLTTVNVLVLMTHTIAQPYSKKWLNMIDTILLADIVVLSLWSTEPITTGRGISKEVHNQVIPYALIFIPTVYLFLSIFVVFFRKLFFNRCNQRCHGMQFSFNLPTMLRSSKRKNDRFQLESNKTTVVDPRSNEEYREPLLEDLDTKTSSESSSSNYGSTVM